MQSKCPRNELHIFSISKAWNELHKPRKKRKTNPKPLAPMNGRGNQRSSQIWWRNEQELPSPESRTAKTSELNGSGGRRGKGIRRPRSFVPVGATNRDKRSAQPFVPVGGTNQDKRPPLSPPLARLAVGPETKATYCPGPKGNRDK